MTTQPFDLLPPLDLLIVGGGINGAGIARDAAGRGLSVLLAEQGDLAGATSSASSKLIHGGLRYLEHREFRLVREALQERDVLLGIAPHIAWPMRFVLPHSPEQRPAWLIRLGLFLYDHLGGRRQGRNTGRGGLPGSRRIRLRDLPGHPVRPDFPTGFEYADCWVDDARLVALNAVDAHARGADIRTRTRCLSATPGPQGWTATLEDTGTGARQQVTARALVNAAGPWVAEMLGRGGVRTGHRARLVKGSHVVVPRLTQGPQAFILQNTDRRVIFAIPYEHDFTLIGTTDVPFEGNPARVAISPEETEYLCRAVSRYLRQPVTPDMVVHSFSGVRSLFDDAAENASAVTRDYRLDLHAPPDQPPLLSVFGGKITTYRRLAEHAMQKLSPLLRPPRDRNWTATAPLPGGDLPGGFDPFLAGLRAAHPWLPPATVHRLARAYGTRTALVLDGARTLADLGPNLGADLTQAELTYLRTHEWARTAEDVLWRRSKLGLRLSPAQQSALADHMTNPVPA